MKELYVAPTNKGAFTGSDRLNAINLQTAIMWLSLHNPVKLILTPGVYTDKMFIRQPFVTVECEKGAYFNGAQVVENPQWEQLDKDHWKLPWNAPTYSTSPRNRDRCELLLVDGEMMIRTDGGDFLDEGEFRVGMDEAGITTHIILRHPDPRGMQVQVTNHRALFRFFPEAHSCTLLGGSYLGSSSPEQEGAVWSQGDNNTIKHITAFNNNAGGYIIEGNGLTVQHNLAYNNGVQGMGGSRLKECTITDNESRGNGVIERLLGWHGEKFTQMEDCLLSRNTFREQLRAAGLWLDIRCKRNRIFRNLFEDCLHAGLFLELESDDNTTFQNIIRGIRKRGDLVHSGFGILCSDIYGGGLEDNDISDCDHAQIMIQGTIREGQGRTGSRKIRVLGNRLATSRRTEMNRLLQVIGTGDPDPEAAVLSHYVKGNDYRTDGEFYFNPVGGKSLKLDRATYYGQGPYGEQPATVTPALWRVATEAEQEVEQLRVDLKELSKMYNEAESKLNVLRSAKQAWDTL